MNPRELTAEVVDRFRETDFPLPRNVETAERIFSALLGVALISFARTRENGGGTLATLAGGALIARGALGYCPINHALGRGHDTGQAESAVLEHDEGVTVDRSVTILRPAAELFSFWRKLENLPEVMAHLESVTTIDERRSRWVAKGPAGTRAEWDAEIIQEIPNEMISWKSTPDSRVPNAGSVHFTAAPGERGTEVRVRLRYDAPFGAAGRLAAKLFLEDPKLQIAEDLRRFKRRMEAGDNPTIDGQPSARESEWDS